MKVIPLEEFMKDDSPAIYGHWPVNKEEDSQIEINLPELQIKTEKLNDKAWWTFAPWDPDMQSLMGLDSSQFDELSKFMHHPVGSVPFDPALTRDDSTIGNDQVLVFEDVDIERMISIFVHHFPEHTKRVLESLNK